MGQLRLFVAVDLPEELLQRIAPIQNALPVDGIKKIELENVHITLKFVGDVEEEKLYNIKQALNTVSFTSFFIGLKGLGVFPNENYVRVVWIGCQSHDLELLARKINDALPEFSKDKFSAHLTIARVKKKIALHQFLESHKHKEFGSFEVKEFHLKQSELSKSGPTYTTLATFTASEQSNSRQ